ncbi:Putative transposase of IS4/5 family [Sinomicrobium oceani]|uniref:Putative transposase of IS4/5 family n=1 Tax=Sinomicrobium oceani TaxID=1150368 RepID=A0A1K1QVD9_9FLAO|nr:Putative transposase of IS4/5 family [Sinomicrobium oceani]
MCCETYNYQNQPFMYSVLDKDTIALEIVPYIPKTNRGFAPTVPLVEIVNAILYKLKTGVQWYQLPVKALFDSKVLSWQSVYYSRSTKCCRLCECLRLRSSLHIDDGQYVVLLSEGLPKTIFTGLNHVFCNLLLKGTKPCQKDIAYVTLPNHTLLP